MRGFTRGGATDTHAAGLAILSLVLEGRLPYAVPPPAGAPIVRRHVGADGREVEADAEARLRRRRGRARRCLRGGVGPTPRTCPRTRRTWRRSIRSARSESTRRARRSTARRTCSRRRALGGFKMKAPRGDAKGAAASYFGRGGNASIARETGRRRVGVPVRLRPAGVHRRAHGRRGGKKEVRWVVEGRRREKVNKTARFLLVVMNHASDVRKLAGCYKRMED